MASISNAAAIAMCNAWTARCDLNSVQAKMRIYGPPKPTLAEDSVGSAALLAELVMTYPAFPVNGAVDTNPGASATANPIASDVSANANGKATFFRVVNSAGEVVIQGTVSDTGGTGELRLSNTDLVAGTPVTVTSLIVTVAESE